jgi:hypothetical protein
MAAEDIGALYNTKIPGLDDAADIQEALKLFLYGSTAYDTTNTDPEDLPNPSLARHLKDLRDDVTVLENLFPGSEYSNTEPVAGDFTPSEIPNGFIWVDGSTATLSTANYATAVYSNTAPTSGLVDGLIWIDKDSSPQLAYIYDASVEDFVPMNPLFNVIDQPGDLLYGTADNTVTRLAVGNPSQVLKVSGGLPIWSDEKQWVLKTSGSLSGSSVVSVSGLKTESFYIVLKDWSHNDTGNTAMLQIRFNNDSGPNYVNTGGLVSASSLRSPAFLNTSSHDIVIRVDLANTASSLKPVSTIADDSAAQYFGYYKNTTAISSIQISLTPTGSFDGGTYQIWSYE